MYQVKRKKKEMNMNMLYMYMFLMIVGSVMCDDIIVNLPTSKVVTESEIEVEISIYRNGIFFIGNLTSTLVNEQGQEIATVFSDTSYDTIAKFKIDSAVQKGERKEFDLKIVGHGRYYLYTRLDDGTLEQHTHFRNVETNVPVVVNPPKMSEKIPIEYSSAEQNKIENVVLFVPICLSFLF